MVMPDGTDRIPTYGPQTQVPRHFKQAAPKVSETMQLGGEVAVAIEPAEVCSVFGVDDIDLATGLLRRLLGFAIRETIDAFFTAVAPGPHRESETDVGGTAT
jgi:hypothetical protein